jgi:hypothetical protein
LVVLADHLATQHLQCRSQQSLHQRERARAAGAVLAGDAERAEQGRVVTQDEYVGGIAAPGARETIAFLGISRVALGRVDRFFDEIRQVRTIAAVRHPQRHTVAIVDGRAAGARHQHLDQLAIGIERRRQGLRLYRVFVVENGASGQVVPSKCGFCALATV